jgi:hypothetical protein
MTNSSTATIPAEPTSSSFVSFVLHQLDCARLRAALVVNEIATTEAGLHAGLIRIEDAVAYLHQLGLVPPSSIAEAA